MQANPNKYKYEVVFTEFGCLYEIEGYLRKLPIIIEIPASVVEII
jgi:hypothetical protein